MEPRPKEIREYETFEGKTPIKEWLLSLRDTRTSVRIITRIKRLAFGYFSDCFYLGDGVFEHRIHFGPGYRIYFGEDKGVLIILLCGGDKSSQFRDIQKAKGYWAEYRGRQ